MAGVSYATFWELHRLLGECYANDVAAIASVTRRSQPGLELAPQWSTSNEASSEDDEKFSSQVLPKRRMSRRASTKPLRTGLSFHGHSHQRTFHEEGGVFDSRSRPQSQEPERRHLSRRPQEMSEHDVNEAPTDGSNTNPCETLLQLQGLAAPPDGDMAELNLKPHPCWEMKENRGRQSNTVRTIRSRKVKQPANSKTSGGSGFHLPSGEFAERWMWLHPSGGFRACWNSLVALLVLYDLLVIPLSVFDHPKSSLMHAMDIGMPIFWSMDFILTFFTGYYQQGELISDFKKIAYQYAMHWMLYDLGLIALDWIFVTMDYFMLSGSEGADWSRSLLMLRILRLARIMRAIKLRQGFDAFQDLLHSQANSLYVSFLTSLGQLLILNHWMACAWFGVRWLHPNDNWVVKSGMDQNYWTHQYLMCMLWSFCQLGVGESPLQPTNETEMVLNCVIAFRSLITSATLISTMSNLIAGLRSLREDEATQFRLLRRFLAQNSIPHEVSHKVTQFLQHQFAKSQKARSSDLRVPLLDLLFRPLFRELQFERHRTSLCKLPVLKALLEAPDIQTLEVMHSTSNSLCQLVAAAQDIIFLSGSHASSSYLKLSGTLTYYDDAGAIEVDNRCWVAEACLWTPWIHMGEFEAKEVSDLLCLDADCFCEALSKTGSTQQAASAYAMEFLAAMQKSGRWTDIFVDHDLNSVDGEAESPKMDLPLPGFCGGFCPRLVRKRPHAPRLQSILPDESDEPDLS